MELTIKILSYALVGSGEGTGVLNNDCIYDSLGIPYIPARRIKGILKEMCYEVCDILGINKQIVLNIFGESGFKRAKINIQNLYINDYGQIKKEIKYLRQKMQYFKLLTKNKLKSYYTTIRQQIAIDVNGIALSKSLRTYRVLKPGLQFKTNFSTKKLTEYEIALLFLACINFRRFGTLRNIGFGKIECVLNTNIKLQNAIKMVKDFENIDKKIPTRNKQFIPNLSGHKKSMYYVIKTLNPIILSSNRGNSNTIISQKIIPSSTIKGLLANLYIQISGLNNISIQDNEHFYHIFLKNALNFNPAYPFESNKIFFPPPAFIQEEKGNTRNNIYNLFLDNVDEETIPLNEFINVDNNNILTYSPDSIQFFHTAINRHADKSNEPEIFYYEALKRDQQFKGTIYGDEGYLDEFKKFFGDKFIAWIGKSKSAQYGKVEVLFGNIEDVNENNYVGDEEFIITAISPIILYNNYGFPESSISLLTQYLETKYNIKIKEVKGFATKNYVEHYVNVWYSKSPRDVAFGEGSSFLIKLDSSIDEDINNILNKMEIEGLGREKENGFGKIKINWITRKSYQKQRLELKEDIKTTIPILKTKPLIWFLLKTQIIDAFRNAGYKQVIMKRDSGLTIPNSLIGRLNGILNKSNDENSLNSFILKMDEKTAQKTLKNALLWNDLLNFKKIYYKVYNNIDFSENIAIANELSFSLDDYIFEYLKVYWVTFFRYMRLENKKKGI